MMFVNRRRAIAAPGNARRLVSFVAMTMRRGRLTK